MENFKLIRIAPYSFTGQTQEKTVDKKTENKDKNKDNKKYSDPLMHWPTRGLAYSNELGAAISEVAPKLGTLLWFPAMLYFGADIYDKYKNKKTSYDPNAQRGLEQAIFQLLASVILPTGAVIAGQKGVSLFGTAGKDGLSLQSQEEIINFIQEFSNRRHLGKYKDNIDSFKNHFTESITTNREKLIRETKIKNPIRLIIDGIFGRRHPESLALSKKDRVLQYANKNIDEMFNIYSDLIENKKPKQSSETLWKKFGKLKEKFAKDPDYKETYLRDAAEDIIKKYQKNKIMNAKIMKTIGGFVALGLAIKPIDNFVENVIIKKVVQPNLETMFAHNQVKKYKEKTIGATNK